MRKFIHVEDAICIAHDTISDIELGHSAAEVWEWVDQRMKEKSVSGKRVTSGNGVVSGKTSRKDSDA